MSDFGKPFLSLRRNPKAASLLPCLTWLALSLTLLTMGCSTLSTPSTPSQPVTPLQITKQPASLTVPLGQTAMFTVSAVGSGTLHYQWSRNGTAIGGATGDSYTTPDTQLSDSGSLYTVAVSDSDSSAISDQAKLSIGARSPPTGDLRFQQVDAPTVADEATSIVVVTNIVIGSGSHSVVSFDGTGSPLTLGPADWNCVLSSIPDCAWGLSLSSLPPGQTGISVLYTADNYQALNQDLAALPTPNSVVTSLDIQPSSGVYAMAVTAATPTAGFDLQQKVVSTAAIQSTVSAEGLKSRVITAVSFDISGQAHLLSYGWQADTSTLYDATTAVVAPADIAATATSLVAQGYILTALGGNDANGYVLVGTKVQGDTLPRSLILGSVVNGVGTSGGSSINGYAPVGSVHFQDPTGQPGTVADATILFEQ